MPEKTTKGFLSLTEELINLLTTLTEELLSLLICRSVTINTTKVRMCVRGKNTHMQFHIGSHENFIIWYTKLTCVPELQRPLKLIHSELKAGHTHALEASHSVHIRFRNKHIALEQLHYHVSTVLGLLQANLSNDRKTKGARYHWLSEMMESRRLSKTSAKRVIAK